MEGALGAVQNERVHCTARPSESSCQVHAYSGV